MGNDLSLPVVQFLSSKTSPDLGDEWSHLLWVFFSFFPFGDVQEKLSGKLPFHRHLRIEPKTEKADAYLKCARDRIKV